MKVMPRKNKWYHSKKIVTTVVSLFIILLGCTIAYLETNKITNFFQDPTDSSSAERTKEEKEEATKNDPTGKTKDETSSIEGVNPDTTTDQIPQSKTANIDISSFTQSNGHVDARVDLTNPSADSICTFTFSKDGARPIVKSSKPDSDTCAISIPELEFEMVGTWQLQVRYFINETQATATKEITIQ